MLQYLSLKSKASPTELISLCVSHNSIFRVYSEFTSSTTTSSPSTHHPPTLGKWIVDLVRNAMLMKWFDFQQQIFSPFIQWRCTLCAPHIIWKMKNDTLDIVCAGWKRKRNILCINEKVILEIWVWVEKAHNNRWIFRSISFKFSKLTFGSVKDVHDDD